MGVMDGIFFCLLCDAWSCICSCMGSMRVLSCMWCMVVSCVHSVAVLNAAVCMICSFFNVGRLCKRRLYGRGSKQHSLQAVKLSQWSQTAVQIVANFPVPSNGCPIYRFTILGQAGHADQASHKSG